MQIENLLRALMQAEQCMKSQSELMTLQKIKKAVSLPVYALIFVQRMHQ